MIGKKQPSPEAAVCSITNLADGKKVSLHRAHTTCDSIYVVDNRIKADVHRRARAPARGSPRRWSFRRNEPGELDRTGTTGPRQRKLSNYNWRSREDAWLVNDANKYPNFPRSKMYYSKPLRGKPAERASPGDPQRKQSRLSAAAVAAAATNLSYVPLFVLLPSLPRELEPKSQTKNGF